MRRITLIITNSLIFILPIILFVISGFIQGALFITSEFNADVEIAEEYLSLGVVDENRQVVQTAESFIEGLQNENDIDPFVTQDLYNSINSIRNVENTKLNRADYVYNSIRSLDGEYYLVFSGDFGGEIGYSDYTFTMKIVDAGKSDFRVSETNFLKVIDPQYPGNNPFHTILPINQFIIIFSIYLILLVPIANYLIFRFI